MIIKITNNIKTHYDWLSIFFHWSTAIIVFSLFGLGFWMVDLTYYHSLYKTAPALHKSIGLSLFTLMILRVMWHFYQVQPIQIESHSALERKAGKFIHTTLYFLLFALFLSGYLISTADGRGIIVFNLFEVPSIGAFINNQEDIAGIIHKYIAYTVILLASLHGFAALKHHFIDKDDTLKRMLGKH